MLRLELLRVEARLLAWLLSLTVSSICSILRTGPTSQQTAKRDRA